MATTMKKIFQKPKMVVLHIQCSGIICVASTVSNVGITGGSLGSSSAARVKEMGSYNDWFDE